MIDRIFIQKIKDLGDKRDMNFREEPEIRSSNHQTTEQLTVQTSASHLNIHACNTLNLIDFAQEPWASFSYIGRLYNYRTKC